MPNNDYYKLVYKILKYLYECLKASEPIDINNFRPGSKHFPVEEGYMDYIWRNLAAEGLIAGVDTIPILGARRPSVKITSELEITPKGIAYLEENSIMKKIEHTIKSVTELISII